MEHSLSLVVIWTLGPITIELINERNLECLDSLLYAVHDLVCMDCMASCCAVVQSRAFIVKRCEEDVLE